MTWAEMTREERTAAINDGVKRKLTASSIAAEFECSKSSVVSHAHYWGVRLLSLSEANREAWQRSNGFRRVRTSKTTEPVYHHVRSHVVEPGENPWAAA